ncbi:MAG: MFS transporter [Pseudomonadota bacterium]
MANTPSELRRNWTIVLVCGIGIGAGVTGIPFYTLGLFVQPLESEFAWSRAQVQGMFTVFSVVGLAAVPLVSWATDRYGVRRVVLLSLSGAALGYVCLSQLTRSLATFYIGAGLLGLLGAGTSPVTWTKALSGWFDQQRGLALGLALAGTGFAAMLAPPYVAALIERFDWRAAYLGLCLIPLLALPLVFALLRDPPGSGPGAAARAVTLPGVTLAQAVRDWRLWVIFVSYFMLSFAVGGSIPNLVPLLTGTGMTRASAAGVVGLIGIAVIAGRMIVGFLIDRFWAPAVAAVVQALPIISALLLMQDNPGSQEAAVAVLLIGFAAGAEFDLIAFLVSRYFGLAHYAKVYAVPYVAFAVGAGIAPTFFGYLFDIYGGYQQVMMLCAGLFGASAVILLALGRYPTLSAPLEVGGELQQPAEH